MVIVHRPGRQKKVTFKQCYGSMKFLYGSGSADPYIRLMDPDPELAIFVSDLEDINKKLFCFLSFFAHFFLKVHLHHFSKIKCRKEVTKQ
jgi:hypothetical protein